VLEPLRAAQRSIGIYLLQVAALATHDEDFVPAAKRALAPVDIVREAAAKRGTKGGAAAALPPVTAETPLPPDPALDEAAAPSGETEDASPTTSNSTTPKPASASSVAVDRNTTDKRATFSATDAAASEE